MDIKERTRSLIAKDRTDMLRRFADTDEKYCFYASIFQCAIALTPKNVYRPGDMIQMAKMFSDKEKLGEVHLSNLLDSIVTINSHLGLEVKKAYTQANVLKIMGVEIEDTGNEVDGEIDDSFSLHAEFTNDDSDITARVNNLREEGWTDIAIIEIGKSTKDGQTKAEVVEKFVIHHGSLKGIVKTPYIAIMTKLKPGDFSE